MMKMVKKFKKRKASAEEIEIEIVDKISELLLLHDIPLLDKYIYGVKCYINLIKVGVYANSIKK